MTYENTPSPFSLRKLIAIALLLGAIFLVAPTFFGIWLPDAARGEVLLIAVADTTNRVLRFRLTQKLNGFKGYTRIFAYTMDDKHWVGMEVGTGQPNLWSARMENSPDYKSLKIFDRDKECLRVEWNSDQNRYVWLKRDGTPLNSKLFSIPDPTPGH